MFKYSIPQMRKFITALMGAATTAFAVGVLPDEYAGYFAILVAFLTSLGVYAVPNEDLNEEGDEVNE